MEMGTRYKMRPMKRKEKITYYFSVEGSTEKWYLDWLQHTINAEDNAKYLVKLDSRVETNPLNRVKKLTVVDHANIIHVFDYESSDPSHVKQFKSTLKRMKEAEGLGKNVRYRLGYSNFTFELWMILHMADCNSSLSYRNQYLELLNRAYKENFQSLSHYKQEDNFKRLLRELTLDHVRKAVQRSRTIMRHHEDVGHKLMQYEGFEYYDENPSLSIWEIIEEILEECNLKN